MPPFSPRTSGAPSVMDLDQVFLPAGSMRQLSRITRLHERGIAAEMDVGSDHWVYELHFPGDPIFPGCLLIEAAGQLVAAHAWHDDPEGRPRLARVEADFRSPVGPEDETLVLSATVRRRRHLHFGSVEVTTGGREVAGVDVVLAVLPAENTARPDGAAPPAGGSREAGQPARRD